MGLCAGCNLDGRNLAESFETFSQLKKERHTKERQTDTTHTHTQTDARAAVGGSLYIHLSMYTRPTLVLMTCQKFCSVPGG
jgi:hypothetical protein